MRKFLILIVLILVGCTTDSVDQRVELVKSNVAAEMGSTANFSVAEEFTFRQYGVNQDSPHNRIITIENKIEFDNNVSLAENDMTYETYYHGVEERGAYSFKSYKDFLNNTGYIRPGSEWYEVELTQMYKLGMASIDPVSIVNAVLYDNQEINFRGEERISVDPELYRIAVADLSSEVFESLFASSIFAFIEVPYEYSVTATMRFNENYQVEYIEFSLNELLQQYEDYQVYELKSEINSIYGSYRLSFDSYDQVYISPVTQSVDWVLDDDYEIERVNELEEVQIGSVKADLVYNDETTTYNTTISIEALEDMNYMYYELYFYRNGELYTTTDFDGKHYSEYYDVSEYDDLILYFNEFDQDIDEVYFVTRYIPKDSSEVHMQAGYAEINVDGPIHNVELDLNIYNDEAEELFPNVLVESVGILGGEPTYEVTFDLYSTVVTRNNNATLYFYENNVLKEIMTVNEFNIGQFEGTRYTKTLNFRPDAIYLDLSYKTAYFWFNEKHIDVDFKLIEEPMDFSQYNNEFLISTYEIRDDQWYAYKYQLAFNLFNDADVIDVFAYLVNEEGEVVGWEHLYDFNVDENYAVVTDLYEPEVEVIYLDVTVDGVQYFIRGTYAIIIS